MMTLYGRLDAASSALAMAFKLLRHSSDLRRDFVRAMIAGREVMQWHRNAKATADELIRLRQELNDLRRTVFVLRLRMERRTDRVGYVRPEIRAAYGQQIAAALRARKHEHLQ